MAVGNKKVEPPVVVVIEEASSEAQDVPCRSCNACLIAYFIKKAFAIIVPEMVGGLLEIRNVEIEPTVVVVVAQRDAHSGHDQSMLGKRHSCGHANLFEGAVMFVVVEVGLH